MQFKTTGQASEVAKTAMLLAYKACGGTTGLGFLSASSIETIEDLDPHVTIEPYWKNKTFSSISADYLAGRMMKTAIHYNDDTGIIEVDNFPPRPDYQGWCSGTPSDPGVLHSYSYTPGGKFDGYPDLLAQAADLLKVSIFPISTDN